jgi:phenylacetate-CoA ligase
MEGSERKYWNMEIEPKLNTAEMREVQLEKLKEALAWQYENTPLNRRRFEKAGVRPEDIASFEEFESASTWRN